MTSNYADLREEYLAKVRAKMEQEGLVVQAVLPTLKEPVLPLDRDVRGRLNRAERRCGAADQLRAGAGHLGAARLRLDAAHSAAGKIGGKL